MRKRLSRQEVIFKKFYMVEWFFLLVPKKIKISSDCSDISTVSTSKP